MLLLATVWMQRRPATEPAPPAPRRRWTRLLAPAACGMVTLAFMGTMTVAFQAALVGLADGPAVAAGLGAAAARPPDAGPIGANLRDLAHALAWRLDLGAVDQGDAWDRTAAWARALWTAAPVLSVLLAALVGSLLAFRYIDVNVFSLQNLYRNRLVRCYLGAARPRQRLQNPYAGFDPSDDFALSALAGQRPFHLVNAALNITRGEDLAWQQRQAASFCFSPLSCGYWLEAANLSGLVARDRVRGGYVPTARYACEPFGPGESAGVMVGTAMATSGAAVSPQMGFQSHGLLAFVLTLFNVRLGRWFPNTTPAHAAVGVDRHSPRYAGGWYLSELLGRTNEKSAWVYLSDGGHFDNLGVYELVRRRCRFIVVVDAGADPSMGFGDLGNCVRKCRVDLGVSIELDLRAFALSGTPPRPAVSHLMGKVQYPKTATEREFVGDILYIKSGLPRTLDEPPADILAFHKEHPQFPHQTTADQWFTESQFESYRQLGYWITRQALAAAQPVFAEIAEPGRSKVPRRFRL